MLCQRIYARDFVAEIYGTVLFIISHAFNFNEEEISHLRDQYNLKGTVYWRSLDNGKQELVEVKGEVPDSFTVDEVAKFTIKPLKHSHGGLFLDAKELRERLKKGAEGEYLNLFSFTGSLSVSALIGGARSVVNIDASKASLSWSRENHENNGVSARHIQEDVLTYLLRDSDAKFDCIIADPPSFGRFKSKIFSIKKDLRLLIQGCFKRLKKHGKFILLYHTRDVPIDDITQYGNEAGFTMYEILPQRDPLFSSAHGGSTVVIFGKS